MAYGTKFELEFVDNELHPRRLQIQKKNYTGSVKSLIGTDDPVIIKWDSDDDIYSPIIGSSCEINLFVTDDTDYDDFYDSDEREYKVQISQGSGLGARQWETTDDTYAAADYLWNEGEESYEFYWEGFLTVDRYAEAVNTKPFPIRLVATDGLGTLDGFDAPISKVNLDSNNNIDTSSQSNFDTLFYYLVEILKLTDLDLDIKISNNIRIKNGAADDTLFHDIEVFEWAFYEGNFNKITAKKMLTEILRFTNSRIFLSNGTWNIISNSNIIDKRMLVDVGAPIVQDINFGVMVNTAATGEFLAVDPQGLSLTFSTVTTPEHGTVSVSGDNFTYTPDQDVLGFDQFRFKANNGTKDSEEATVRLEIVQPYVAANNPFNQSGHGTNITGEFYYSTDFSESISLALQNRRGTGIVFYSPHFYKGVSTDASDIMTFPIGFIPRDVSGNNISASVMPDGFYANQNADVDINNLGGQGGALVLQIADTKIVGRFVFPHKFNIDYLTT